ncbi:MAG: flagellar capping protein [Lachnospiraceae bacterium]|jgi:flagellar hook-associated protein 2|nr:flagellar capping protein [Lachnospiraceae bacterium]
MAYSAALNTIYNHYLSTYSSLRPSQYDTHKKSELRNVYHSIIKQSKESPLYLTDDSEESHAFAVGLKENARQLRNTIAALGGLDETGVLNKKVAYSTDSHVIDATFVGDSQKDAAVASFDIYVNSLASHQINQGVFLPPNEEVALPAGSYSFDLGLSDLNYEFQFNVHKNETNADVQNRLVRLFKNAEIGLSAELTNDEQGNLALRLTSNATGISPGKTDIFNISDDKTSKSSGAVSYFGLANVQQKATNADFLLNGEQRSAHANHFTVEKMFELNLNGINHEGDAPVHVGLKTDIESIRENIDQLIGGYNSFIQSSSAYAEAHPDSNRFLSEMKNITRLYRKDIGELGLSIKEDGQIALTDDQKLADSFANDDGGGLNVAKNFTNSVLRKANQISLNPMEYVDKKIVAYKHPVRTFANPYITSAYSGMLFNGYC